MYVFGKKKYYHAIIILDFKNNLIFINLLLIL